MLNGHTVSPSHTIITVSDYDRSVAFYTNALNFALRHERTGEAAFEPGFQLEDVKFREGFMVLETMMIALVCFERPRSIPASPHAFNRVGINQIAFNVSDIDATAQSIVAHGGRVHEETRQTTPFGTLLTATDPDGTLLDLIQRTT